MGLSDGAAWEKQYGVHVNDKKILIAYWHGSKLMEYEHNQEFEHTIEKQREIVENVIFQGFSVMLLPSEKQLTIFIDKGRFRQS